MRPLDFNQLASYRKELSVSFVDDQNCVYTQRVVICADHDVDDDDGKRWFPNDSAMRAAPDFVQVLHDYGYTADYDESFH